jgi:hypothetical protein
MVFAHDQSEGVFVAFQHLLNDGPVFDGVLRSPASII